VDQWISRRRFTDSMAALAAASLTGLPAFPAIGQEGQCEQDNPAGQLPLRIGYRWAASICLSDDQDSFRQAEPLSPELHRRSFHPSQDHV
jgi:hypothetical protein